jgi:hypothetical protein
MQATVAHFWTLQNSLQVLRKFIKNIQMDMVVTF